MTMTTSHQDEDQGISDKALALYEEDITYDSLR
jgi:hypothetical protein